MIFVMIIDDYINFKNYTICPIKVQVDARIHIWAHEICDSQSSFDYLTKLIGNDGKFLLFDTVIKN